MTDRPILFDADAMRALLAGRKKQERLLAGTPLRECRPGDRLWVKEAFIGAAASPDGAGELAAKVHGADYLILADGWRQYRDGTGRPGPVPTNRRLTWMAAIHMPRWASRATLVVDSVRREKLQAVTRNDMIREGRLTGFAGLYWNRHGPVRGLWRDPRRAFAAMWDAVHGTPGERWEDDPDIIVLDFRLVR